MAKKNTTEQTSAPSASAAVQLTPDKFKIVGFTQEEANKIDRPTISYWQDAWRRLRKNPVAMGALFVLGLLIIMVIAGPYIRGYDYINMNVTEKNLGSSAKYWFGTDSLGRDLFSRVWVGARASIIIALVATALKLVVGTLYGAAMAHFGGWVDDILMRIIEVINSLPSLLITILIMMILGNNLFALLVALSITAWCNTARQTRGSDQTAERNPNMFTLPRCWVPAPCASLSSTMCLT